VGKGRVAGTENLVFPKINVELLFQCHSHVDLCNDPKPDGLLKRSGCILPRKRTADLLESDGEHISALNF